MNRSYTSAAHTDPATERQWMRATLPAARIAGALLVTLAACLQPSVAQDKSSPADAARTATEQGGVTEAETSSEDTQRAVERIFQEPLSGVVVNRTVTVLGKDFYRDFSTYWRHHQESTRYSISIHERPTARFGSEIWVLYRQQRMFHIFLPPARAATRGISEVAVQQVLENISQRELERLTTRNPDLGPEEL